MKPSIENKLAGLVERHEEIGMMLTEQSTIQNQNKFRELSKEYADLEPLVATFKRYQSILDQQVSAKALLAEDDAEMREMAEEELKDVAVQIEVIEKELQLFLIPKDPDDDKNVFLEIRGGAGGDEAAIFAGNLFRMYSRYAEQKRWRVEIISESFGEHGGYKEVIARIIGQDVYSHMKFESGAHRVQRVPHRVRRFQRRHREVRHQQNLQRLDVEPALVVVADDRQPALIVPEPLVRHGPEQPAVLEDHHHRLLPDGPAGHRMARHEALKPRPILRVLDLIDADRDRVPLQPCPQRRAAPSEFLHLIEAALTGVRVDRRSRSERHTARLCGNAPARVHHQEPVPLLAQLERLVQRQVRERPVPPLPQHRRGRHHHAHRRDNDPSPRPEAPCSLHGRLPCAVRDPWDCGSG